MEFESNNEPQRPTFDKLGVPHCAYNACPSYDGKRCELLGARPDGICEPAVIDMASDLIELRALRAEVERTYIIAPKGKRVILIARQAGG